MKKKILLTVAMATSMVFMSAQVQTPTSYETIGSLSKNVSGSCVAMKVNTDLKNAMTLMQDLLKSEGLTGKKSGNSLLYDKTVFPTISSDYINFDIAFEATNKSTTAPVTTVMCFVTKGINTTNFINSNADPDLIGNLKNFLDQKYAARVYDNDVQQRVNAKNKEITQTNNDLTGLQKTIDQRTKDIAGYNKDIEKAKDNITKANKDIETAKKTIDVKKNLLQKQQDELKLIK